MTAGPADRLTLFRAPPTTADRRVSPRGLTLFRAPPAVADLARLRGRLSPGRVLTLFRRPPTVADLAGSAPAAEYYGLIQDAPGGPVRFQLVLPSQVAQFPAAARGAHRSGLYFPTDPAARTAVTPADGTG